MTATPAPTAASDIVRGCREVCRRCQELVATIHAAEPAAAGRVWAAVGAHLRHCADHFTAFFRGVPRGTVDYDARDRDPELEADPDRMLSELVRIDGELARIELASGSREIAVLQLAAPGDPPRPVASTVERELVFLSSHTIHHLALMIRLAAEHGVAVPEELGVAFSTAAHRGSAAGG